MKKTLKYAAVATALASVLLPMVVLAGNLTVPPPPIGDPNEGITGRSLENLLNQIASFVLTISVIIAVIVIVYGGVIGLTKGWDKAKEILLRAVIGLAIIFGVGLIMQTIANIVARQSIN